MPAAAAAGERTHTHNTHDGIQVFDTAFYMYTMADVFWDQMMTLGGSAFHNAFHKKFPGSFLFLLFLVSFLATT
jgi:hypothetical protein